MFKSSALIVIFFSALNSGVVAQHLTRAKRQVYDGNWVIEDMVLPLDIFQQNNKITPDTLRWPNRTVVYNINDNLNNTARKIIRETMDGISAKTCIIFRQKTETDAAFVELTAEPHGRTTFECDNRVGRQGNKQRFTLGGRFCLYVPLLQHELMHVIGIFHEHLRPDRDQYINVHWDNIQDWAIPYYALKFPNTTMLDFGLPYDYRSVMHYPNSWYAIDDKKPTLSKKGCPDCILGGVVSGMSDLDYERINRMYGCSTVKTH